jgi:hypothetical protein
MHQSWLGAVTSENGSETQFSISGMIACLMNITAFVDQAMQM